MKKIVLFIVSILLITGLSFAMGENPTKFENKLIIDTPANREMIYASDSIFVDRLPTNNIIDITDNIKIQIKDGDKKSVYWKDIWGRTYFADPVYVFKGTYNGITGYFVSKNPDSKLVEKINKANKIKMVDAYISKNPSSSRFRQAFIKNSVVKGMTKQDVLFSWGEPRNENTNSEQYLEQWVYRSNYLYFTNGILVSWQSNNY